MNRKQYILEQAKKNDLNSTIDKIQNYADFVGLLPGAGDVVDLASAGVDVIQGFATGDKDQFVDAGFRAAAAAPVIGTAVGIGRKGGQLGKKALQAVSIGAPAAGGVMRALQPDTPKSTSDEKNEFLKKSIEAQKGVKQPETKQAETDKPKSDEEEKEPFDFSKMYNTRLISHAPLQQFRSLQTNSFQQELDNTTDILAESIIARGSELVTGLGKKLFTKGGKKRSKKNNKDDDKKDDDNKEPSRLGNFLKYATGVGLGSAGLIGAGAAAPALLGGLFGAGQTDSGQPLVPASGQQGAGDSGVGAVGSVVDRLTSAYGYIPGFNPAGIAIQTLGRRVGAP